MTPVYAEPDLAAHTADVAISTLRKWKARGHITRHADGRYDLTEILAYIDRRRTGRPAIR